jgi:hypothetical protein
MQMSNLAGGPRPGFCRQTVSGPKAAKLYQAKKKLIATAPGSKIHLTYWKQTDCSISNCDMDGQVAFCSSHLALVISQCFYE